MPFAPIDIKSIQLDRPQSFSEGMKLGAKKRALGIAEFGVNALDSIGVAPESMAYAKELMADVGKDYNQQGQGTGIKGAVAEILGDPLTYLPAASLSKILGQGALMGATSATGDKDSDLTDNLINAGSGAAVSGFGYGAGKLLTKAARPVGDALNDVGKAAVAKLEAAGVPLSAAQKTGSKALANIESVFNTLPMTSGKQQKFAQKQANSFTKAALKEAGLNVDDASRASIEKASKQFGEEYAALTSKNTLKVDENLLQRVSDIYQDASSGRLGMDASNLVRSVSQDIFNSGDEITGKTYQNTRSMLTQKAYGAKDPYEAGVMKQLRNELDAAFERGLPDAEKGVMSKINKRYQAFKPIQKAMETSKQQSIMTGNIDPTTLYSKVDVGAPLSDLADAGRGVLPSQIPDSGTAQRIFTQNVLTGGGIGGATYLGTQDPETAAAAGALALLAPRGAQSLYNSKIAQKYLTSGMPKAVQAATQAASVALPRAIASTFSANRVDNRAQPAQSPFATIDINSIKLDEQFKPVSMDGIQLDSQNSLKDRIVNAESSGNPNAKNPLSSASGLYQFTDSTWRSVVDKFGRKYGVKYSDKNDPQKQSIMMDFLMKDNARILQNKGIEPTGPNIYFAHFMGAPAASKAISMLGKGAIAARSFPDAAKANPTVFFDGKRPRTVDEVYELITSKVV